MTYGAERDLAKGIRRVSDTQLPSFEVPSASEAVRNPLGWALLFTLMAALFLIQLTDYLGRDSSVNASFKSYSDTLRMEVYSREAVKTFGVPVPSDSSESLEKLTAELKPRARTQPEAAMIYAAAQYELARRIKPEDISVLGKGTPEQRAFSTIYGSSVLTKSDVDTLSGSLNKAVFLDRLALAHAKQKAGIPRARDGLVTRSQVVALEGALMVIIGALVLGMMALSFLIVKSISSPMPGHPAQGLSLAQADDLALRTALVLILYLVLSTLAAVHTGLPRGTNTIICACLAIAATAMVYRRPVAGWFSGGFAGLKDIGLRSKPNVRLVAWGVLGAVANAPVVLAMGLLGQLLSRWLPPAEHPIETELLSHPSPLLIFAIFVTASIQAPFIEEIMFRGSMLPALARVLKSPLWAGVISSCLFAIIHPTGIPAWPALAAIGGMSAFLTYRTGSLVPSVVMHAVHNFVTMALALALN